MEGRFSITLHGPNTTISKPNGRTVTAAAVTPLALTSGADRQKLANNIQPEPVSALSSIALPMNQPNIRRLQFNPPANWISLH